VDREVDHRKKQERALQQQIHEKKAELERCYKGLLSVHITYT
jgi:hypothetical protein